MRQEEGIVVRNSTPAEWISFKTVASSKKREVILGKSRGGNSSKSGGKRKVKGDTASPERKREKARKERVCGVTEK